MLNGIDLQSIVDTHWNKSWTINKVPSSAEITPEMLSLLAEVSQSSMHFSDGTFEELSVSQTKDLVRRFCDKEKLKGTIKFAIGDAAEGDLEDWKQAFPGAKIRINYFLSTGPAKGIRAHFDNHHVFAVQLLGEKVWNLGPRVAIATPESPSFYPEKEPLIEATIHTQLGDVLYIPSGGWHATETLSQSVHATIGIYPPTYAEYLRQLIAERASSDIVLRSELPPIVTNEGKEVRFAAPSLATVRELTERSARVSANKRASVSSHLQLVHETELAEEIEKVTAAIWKEAEIYGRVALYVRGSSARPNVSGLQPWDIDLVLVTRQSVPDNALRSSREKVNGLELDIKYVTVRDLIDSERELSTRSLLRSEGILLHGQDIVCDLPTAQPSKKMAAAIALRQVQACQVNDALLEEGDIDRTMTQRFAKAALRLGTPLIMLQLSRLERDPIVCGWFITANHPDLRLASEYLAACVRGENDASETQEMSRRLLEGLQGKLNEIGGNTSE